MQLNTIIYGIVIIILIIVIAIVSVVAARRKWKLQIQCPPIPLPFRSVMGVQVNYREEEKEIKKKDSSASRLSQYNEDAATEVAMIFVVALVKWITLPARREVPAGYCEADWRNKTWKDVVEGVGLPVELYEDVMETDYRFVKSFKSKFEQFKDAISIDNSTERKFIEARKSEFKSWVQVRNNFIAKDVEKYMNALKQYSEINLKTSMDIKSYGEVVIIQPQCTSAPATTPSPQQQPTDEIYPTKSFFNSYSTQQRIAFMILIIVAIMCIVAIVLEEIWRLSPSDTL
jgi:hypothetical protein